MQNSCIPLKLSSCLLCSYPHTHLHSWQFLPVFLLTETVLFALVAKSLKLHLCFLLEYGSGLCMQLVNYNLLYQESNISKIKCRKTNKNKFDYCML